MNDGRMKQTVISEKMCNKLNGYHVSQMTTTMERTMGRMKINRELYGRMIQAIKLRLEANIVSLRELRKAYKDAGQTEERFRWDLWWSTGPSFNVYNKQTNISDNHVDTALKRIVTELATEEQWTRLTA